MAFWPMFLLLLWDLTGVTSLCNVTCSTDYNVSLNCSCSGSVPTYSVLLKVNCSDGDLEVNGLCEVNPPKSWCIMYPEMLYDVASFGTMCTATVSQHGDQVIMSASESSRWALSYVVKPLPPFDVQVTNTEGFYNITWDHDNQQDCLKYMVRIRESKDLSKVSVHSISVEKKHHFLLDHKMLQPFVNYTVDVKTKFCPGILYEGPWSEWSSTAEWRTIGTHAEIEGMNWCRFYVLLSIIVALGTLGILMVLGYLHKPYLKKKLQVITYIPSPDEFFKPLHHNYGGNFKEWVKPVFTEYDYLRINSQVLMKNDLLQWNNEKQSYREDQSRQGGHFLHMLQPQSNSQRFFQDGGSSQGTSHSIGHISIHTVTLSGEEEFEEEIISKSSGNTLKSYQDGESFGSFGEDNREHVCYDVEEPQMFGLDRQSGELPHHHHENQISNDLSVENINFHPRIQLNEPERVSLDSFASNEQSEDGYPHVDLDTIDSGFGECSSPGASDSNTAEQIDSDSFHEHKSSNSNYVKQWMVCSTIQEDSTKHSDY